MPTFKSRRSGEDLRSLFSVKLPPGEITDELELKRAVFILEDCVTYVDNHDIGPRQALDKQKIKLALARVKTELGFE